MNRFFVKFVCCQMLVVAAVAETPSPAVEAGKKAEKTACVACHSLRLIHSQRLSSAAWTKEVGKMMGWGAVVQDKQALIDYLASAYSNLKPVPTPDMSLNGVGH
jgi:mono/diheme cytochrome c family protein